MGEHGREIDEPPHVFRRSNDENTSWLLAFITPHLLQVSLLLHEKLVKLMAIYLCCWWLAVGGLPARGACPRRSDGEITTASVGDVFSLSSFMLALLSALLLGSVTAAVRLATVVVVLHDDTTTTCYSICQQE